MPEINPTNPVTSGLRDQWYKLLALVLWKYRGKALPDDVVLVREDFERIEAEFQGRGMPTVLAHDRDDGLHIRLIDEGEARRLAHETRATN